MSKKIKKSRDSSAEEKIKEAARKLFTQKGFAAVRTRDIAEEAGINLALLNYYFRSKEKLFDIIMKEAMQQFMEGVSTIFYNEKTTVDEKLNDLVSCYIDMLSQYPDLPLFILSELKSNPDKFAEKMDSGLAAARSHFMKQIQKNHPDIHIVHFMANMMGLIIFPFIGAPILQKVTRIDKKEFSALMQERKKMIPIWIKAMIKAK
jgi:AcrR family transcriptional regulator